jgi:Flp pilus assembly protein CpaB
MARMSQGLPLPSGNRGLLIIAALAGLAAAVLFVVAVRTDNGSSSAVSGSAGGNTVFAAKNIPAGDKIEANMLATKTVPGDLRAVGALEDPAIAEGQYAANDITEGEQITPGRIGAAAGQGVSSVIDPKWRGMGLEIKEVTAVGGLLYNGDRVDVIGTFKVANELRDCNQPYMLRTETILQNVQVLSVAQDHEKSTGATNSGTSDPNSGASGNRSSDPKLQPGASTITLALTPADSQVLASAQDRARTVWTSLRPVGETEPAADLQPLDKCLYE